MKTLKRIFTALTILLSVVLFQSCKDKSPTIAKIFVRSNSNELLQEARVVLIADVDKNESSIEYVDTVMTNSSGFAEFNLKDYYDQAGAKISVATFTVICRKSGKEGIGKIRTRIHTTAVETIFAE
ncbi:MAG: hypothetical protein M9916_02260 [Crocinitomicaceae bacterium]|nr:hypothetical protein [Crocinitomicaceae bacterium]